MRALRNGQFETPEGITEATESLPLGVLVGKWIDRDGKRDVIVSDVRFEDERFIKLVPVATEGEQQ